MEDYSNLCSTYLYQDEGIEELRNCVLYISELEATIVATKDEITRKEIEILNLKHILIQTIKERNEAKQESKKLLLEKAILQHQEQETASSEESDSDNKRLLPEIERELPEKGKLLQAVKEAGPLLHTLLLAGPLPQWHHPPPNLHDSNIHIQPPIFNNKRPFDSSPPPPMINKYQKVSLF